MTQAQSAINRRSKIYSTDREDEISEIFISLLCVWRVWERFRSIHAERLQIYFSPRKQNESIWNRCKSLARFNTRNKWKETFNLSLGEKSQTSLTKKPTLNFSGPIRKIRPEKLTNHSARNERYTVSAMYAESKLKQQFWKGFVPTGSSKER